MKRLLSSALALAALFGAASPTQALTPPAAIESFQVAAASGFEAECVSNHDGDTITVRLDSGKVEKIRLLGIDTAEIAQGEWGAKAREFTSALVKGKRVRLEFDVQQRDRYGRLLAYVYTQDGRFVNLELMKAGMAMLLTYAPNVAHVDEFRTAQTAAREAGLGIWGANGLKESPHDFRHKGERRGNQATTPTQPSSSRSVAVAGRPAQQTPAKPAATAGKVSMNRNSHKYHEPGCRYYGCANCEEVLLSEAQAHGGVPCKLCH